MRAWIIVLSSLIAGVATAGGLALAWLPIPIKTPADIVQRLLPHVSALALAALAVYGLAALLLTTATLVGDLILLRRRLLPLTQLRAPSGGDLREAFGASWLRPLAAQLATSLSEPNEAGPTAGISEFITPSEIRREIARLHYVWLARSQFLTALALLTLVAVGGIAQGTEPLLATHIAIPTVLAWLALTGLVILTAASRAAIDVAVEPVVELVARLPSEQLETRLLRRITTLIRASSSIAPPPMKRQLSNEALDRLARRIEGSRRAWVEGAANLSAAADTLQSTIRASVESMETSLQSTMIHLPATELDAGRLGELQRVLERLIVVIEHHGVLLESSGNEAARTEQAGVRSAGNDQLAGELAKLLREFEVEP